jgi:hypothetical protein
MLMVAKADPLVYGIHTEQEGSHHPPAHVTALQLPLHIQMDIMWDPS